MSFVWLRLLATVLLALAPLPARAQDVPSGPCDDLASQVDATSRQLDQEQQNAQPWLIQAGRAAPIVLGELTAVALRGAPDLTPDLAGSLGAIAAQVGAQIDGWRNSGGSIRDLPAQLNGWEITLVSLVPFVNDSANLIILNTALMQLDQVAANVIADGAILDDLNSQLQDCQRQNPPPPPPTTSDGSSGSTCMVGDATGASNSECFTLELDAALAVWTACTNDYFAAEREAFRTGGDLPINACDPAFKAAQDAIQQRWASP
jgi:hypothetical protein